MKKSGPYTGMDKAIEHSVDRIDLISWRALIAARARSHPKEQFNSLAHHLTYALVEQCLDKIPKGSTPGIDGMEVIQAQSNLHWILPPLLKQIHQGQYEAPAVRRAYIPKGDGKQRPIGVPGIIDRSIQAAMAQILNEIYEQDFLKSSFGFRPNLGCHHALATISSLLMKWNMNYVFEVDVRDFFGSLNHDWLRRFLGLRIGDKRVLKLIDAWLTAGVMEKDEWVATEVGTAQGGSISPLLANIYLHYVLDLWFDRRIKKQFSGAAHLVRYCDDFVILFKSRQGMEAMKPMLITRLNQFGLEISEEKTHMTDLTPRERQGAEDRRRMTFLGFNVIRAVSRTGGNKTVFQTEGKRFARAKAKMKEQVWKMMHFDIQTQVKRINAILRGHFNYYGLPGNSKKLQGFRDETLRYWRQCLSKRSQNGRVNWIKMETILKQHQLVGATLKIPYGKLDSYVRL